MKLKNVVTDILQTHLKWGAYKHYSRQFKRYCAMQGISDAPVKGENEYKKKWSVLTPRVEPYSFRLFSRYMGNDACIIPEDIGHIYLEQTLNPRRYWDYYSDKNIFDDMFRKGTMPVTVFRRIGGSCLLDADYQPVNFTERGGICSLIPFDRILLKPSVDSGSGHGVMLFEKVGSDYIAKKEQVKLTQDFLLSYGDDFILQEAIEQHPALAQFNPTSVNTLRLLTYRSVKDERVRVVAGILRIGRNGEVCDNAHMGGRIININLRTGVLGKYTCDQYGTRSDTWNGINFQSGQFAVPAWEKAAAFAEYVSGKIRHCRLIQLDVTIDKAGIPKLIEFNVSGCGFWLYMFCGQRVFGDYTDEVIEYCSMRRNKQLIYVLYKQLS